MTEREVFVAACVAVVAAAIAPPLRWWVVVLVIAGAGMVLRADAVPGRLRAAVAMLALGAVTGLLAHRAEAGLAPPSERRVDGDATLRTDPVRRPGGYSFELSVGGRRYLAGASGTHAVGFSEAAAGDRVHVIGRVGPLQGPWEWRASRHLSGRLRVDRFGELRSGAWWWEAANRVRDVVAGGMRTLDSGDRALALGVMLGDDRDQTVVEQFRFRSAGLSHLMAVSGQNVAFLLILAGPALRRLGLRSRWLVGITLIGWFAVVTRLEPSVLRASMMAAIAATAAGLGRYVTGVRVVSTAVCALVLIDPLLVWSLGFRLSVLASLSLVVLARPVSAALQSSCRCGRHLADALGVTLAAQAGTAPLLALFGGSVPILGVVANLLAVPVAGLLMVSGLVVAPLAAGAARVGLPALESMATLPVAWMCRWLAGVARWFADPSLPRVGVAGAVAMSVAVGALAWSGSGGLPTHGVQHARRWAAAGCVVVGGVVIAEGFVSAGPGVMVERSLRLVRGESAAVLVVDAGATDRAALQLLGAASVDRIDVVVVPSGGRGGANVIWALRQVVDVGVVLAAEPEAIRDAIPLEPGLLGAGDVRLNVSRQSGDGWRVESAP